MSILRSLITGALLVCVLLLGTASLSAQANDGVVYAVFFYSPSCPHCHYVMDNYVPQWEEEFGDSLVIIYVDVSASNENLAMFRATCETLQIPSCGGVPMMVIGNRAMIGSQQIPAEVPALVHNGRFSGGVGLPPVAELEAAFGSMVGQTQTGSDPEGTAEATAEPPVGVVTTPPPASQKQSLADKLSNDPEGNAIAIVTLVALVASFIAGVWFIPQGIITEKMSVFSGAILILLVATAAMAGTLAVKESGDAFALVSAWGALGLIVIALVFWLTQKSPEKVIPLVTLSGMLVAMYLAQIETSDTEAVCGLVGDCNAVQQSKYASLLGVPIGVLGFLGYVAIFAAWSVIVTNDTYKPYAQVALLGMALFGVAFSTYLTFLEPFVIGATCAWCITSALSMMLMLWLIAPEGWRAFRKVGVRFGKSGDNPAVC